MGFLRVHPNYWQAGSTRLLFPVAVSWHLLDWGFWRLQVFCYVTDRRVRRLCVCVGGGAG